MPYLINTPRKAVRENSGTNGLLTDIEKTSGFEVLQSSPTSSDKTAAHGRTATAITAPAEQSQQQWRRADLRAIWRNLTRRKLPPPSPETARSLSWRKLTICLIVEAIALGTLGMPSAFASMGLLLSLVVSLILGILSIYTALVLGAVKVQHPAIRHYADAVGLIWGTLGCEVAGAMFVALLVLLLGSHALTGTIAFERIVDAQGVCGVLFGAVSAVLLFALALPPSFSEFAVLGYVDFGSILIAIATVTVASGIQHFHSLPHAAVDWSWYPPPTMTFQSAFLAMTNIIFAYTFAVALPTFMTELHTPADHPKAIWTLGIAQTILYTLSGALNYVFMGATAVESPVLLSAQPRLVSRVAFGLALPVIYISGSINSNVVGAYIFDRWLPGLRQRRGKKFWILWTSLIAGITILSWVIAASIPFFNALLGLISSLFTSGFTFYFPALFWFLLVKKGRWNGSWKNVALSALNTFVLGVGLALLVCGTYVSVWQILEEYRKGEVSMPFSCKGGSYKKEISASGVEYS